MFIMENVWKSIYIQPTLCERPLLPFYQLGNLSCQFDQGAKMKRWLRGGSHKAMVKKVCHRPTEVFYDFWPIVLFGRICVLSVTIAFLCTLFKYLQSQSQSPKLPHFMFFLGGITRKVFTFQVWQYVSWHLVWTTVQLTVTNKFYLASIIIFFVSLGIWCEHLCS